MDKANQALTVVGMIQAYSVTNIALGITSILRKVSASNPRFPLIDTDSQEHAPLPGNRRSDLSHQQDQRNPRRLTVPCPTQP
jgi:hypothetical protein